MSDKTGHLYSLNFIPSRSDCIGVSYGNPPHSYDTYHGMFSAGPDAVVTADGEPVTVGELFAWLAEPRNVEITLHPDAMRYGLSLLTQFRGTGPLLAAAQPVAGIRDHVIETLTAYVAAPPFNGDWNAVFAKYAMYGQVGESGLLRFLEDAGIGALTRRFVAAGIMHELDANEDGYIDEAEFKKITAG